MKAARLPAALAALALLAFPGAAPAQKYPERTVRLVVAFPTGASQILGLALVGETARSAEAGMPELVVITWYGLFAPAAMKPDVIERLNSEVNKLMTAPETKAQLAKVELDVKPATSAEFAKFVRDETERLGG